MLNFPESKFAGRLGIKVVKNEVVLTSVDCVEQHIELENWLESKFQLSLSIYDYSSTICPTDAQTVLLNEERFEKTTHQYQGRTIYREFATKYYWYVDNLHFGYKAHIEVFSGLGTHGKHLGEANLSGEIDRSKSDVSKKLNI